MQFLFACMFIITLWEQIQEIWALAVTIGRLNSLFAYNGFVYKNDGSIISPYLNYENM